MEKKNVPFMAFLFDDHVQSFGVQPPSKLNPHRRWREKGTNHKNIKPLATKMVPEPLNHQHKNNFLHVFGTFSQLY